MPIFLPVELYKEALPFPAAQIGKADVGDEVKNGEIYVSESESEAS